MYIYTFCTVVVAPKSMGQPNPGPGPNSGQREILMDGLFWRLRGTPRRNRQSHENMRNEYMKTCARSVYCNVLNSRQLFATFSAIPGSKYLELAGLDA